ncbi:MAG: hypothetical protein KC420_08630 [Myxococcales bacterium]|nr:hypothetical protein [Myxococcales bacterium]MCB9569430.1 hypothetical protein [Myxococcales bacterium]MCB9706239.1 hypothetical protein [Myxococcales bacterium]
MHPRGAPRLADDRSRRGGREPLGSRRPLAALTALALLLAQAPDAHAARLGPDEEAAALYEEGRRAQERGDFDVAADRFTAAYETLPREDLERRAAVLFELVEARRSAFSEDGRPFHLCRADEALDRFLADNQEIRGSRSSRDARKAGNVRTQLAGEISQIKAENPGFDCANAPEPEPEPEPEDENEPEPEPEPEPEVEPEPARPAVRLRDPLVGSGVALVSVGGLLLGSAAMGLALGAHAEFEGTWLLSTQPGLSSTSPEVEALQQAGRRANLLAIIGGALGSATFGAGIALYVVGKRRQAAAAPPVALVPSLSPRNLGAGLQMRF